MLVASKSKAVLVTAEIQKVSDWSETVKALWDGDSRNKIPLVCGLQKFSDESVRSRRSSPKLLALDPSLITANDEREAADWQKDPESMGHLIENIIGSHLWRASKEKGQLYYWSDGKWELDFVYTLGSKILAIEVKSGQRQRSLSGLTEFKKRYPDCRSLIVGSGGVPLEEFLSSSPWDWL